MKRSIVLAILGTILSGYEPTTAETKTKWSGLQGWLLVYEQEVTLPDKERQKEGERLVWYMSEVVSAGQTPNRFKKQNEFQEVRLHVGPYEKTYSKGSRFGVNRQKGPLQGMLLSYPLEVESTQLKLEKEVTDNSVWKVHDRISKSNRRQEAGRRDKSYTEFRTFEFRLEARHRPGWFLFVDDKSRIRLTNDPAQKLWIKVEYETFHDDLKDGK